MPMDPRRNLTDFDRELASVLDAHRERIESDRRSASKEAMHLASRWETFADLLNRLRAEVFEPTFRSLNERVGPLRPTVNASADGRSFTVGFPRNEAHPADAQISMLVTRDDAFEKLLVSYEFGVIPLFMELEPRQDFRTPIDSPDVDSLRAWLGERILQSIKSYLSMETSPHYQNRTMSIDPVLRESFPDHLAAGTATHDGVTYRFKTEESKRLFESEPGKFTSRL